MNELQVKTITLEPAKVVFNHEEIEKDLEKNLQKYSGLTFTEDDATECRKTIADLRKGKKAVDEYRKDIKKQLNEPVKEFEDKCKALNKKFDEVIDPLIEQSDAFEIKRRDEKRIKVQEVIGQLIEDFDLYEKHAVELVVLDSHLTKSKTMKSIAEELETQAAQLKTKQDKEAADKELIASTVKLANVENGIKLSESAYISLIDYRDVESIKQQIADDAEKEVEKQTKKEEPKIEPHPIFEPKVEEIPFTNPTEPIHPVIDDKPEVFEVYKVTGTEQQLSALESFMTSQGLGWEVVDSE
ncbi:hypothetical protein GCM10011409_21300 [Lentibacillus populi]|uniref:DUF1351 domain-containing protein n=1 Tax=Lentibacillus populi TaxID=1827502 RepID=A0A9W5X5F6_9BACI|nr:DUF1351 domain-containing protein [Lentibacillus populi]MBT2215872.1 DUF1351 domain-containing protein [Virgibacillus dakarensis]MBT2215944.1 DUF1351 domain-containing protein [Virgibacillus dakarensis]GGB43427.1 hypothetical protein GCM10011409_21300 [Lentibacillus populi]